MEHTNLPVTDPFTYTIEDTTSGYDSTEATIEVYLPKESGNPYLFGDVYNLSQEVGSPAQQCNVQLIHVMKTSDPGDDLDFRTTDTDTHTFNLVTAALPNANATDFDTSSAISDAILIVLHTNDLARLPEYAVGEYYDLVPEIMRAFKKNGGIAFPQYDEGIVSPKKAGMSLIKRKP